MGVAAISFQITPAADRSFNQTSPDRNQKAAHHCVAFQFNYPSSIIHESRDRVRDEKLAL